MADLEVSEDKGIYIYSHVSTFWDLLVYIATLKYVINNGGRCRIEPRTLWLLRLDRALQQLRVCVTLNQRSAVVKSLDQGLIHDTAHL